MKKPIKAAPKPAPKKKVSPRPVKEAAMASTRSMDTTVSIRKISNGYIVREEGMVGTGKNAKWTSNETFTTKKPEVVMK